MAASDLLYGEQELDSKLDPELDDSEAEEDRRSCSNSNAMGLSNKLSEG